MSRREANQLVGQLRDHFREVGNGYTVELRGGHWTVCNQDGQRLYSFGSTPSEHRFRLNTISAMRRLGIVPPGWRG